MNPPIYHVRVALCETNGVFHDLHPPTSCPISKPGEMLFGPGQKILLSAGNSETINVSQHYVHFPFVLKMLMAL